MAESAAGSLAAVAVAQVALLVSGILSARLLGVEGRGYLAILVLVQTVLIQVGTLGLPTALTYFLAHGTLTLPEAIGQLRRSVIFQAYGLSLVYVTVLMAILWNAPPSVRWSAILCTLSLPAILLLLYGYAVLQGLNRFRVFNIVRVFAPLSYSAILTVIFICPFDAGIGFVVGSWVASNVSACIVTWLAISKGVTGATPTTHTASVTTEEIRHYGYKAILGDTATIDSFRADQVIAGMYLSIDALGIYVASVAYTNLPRFFAQSLGLVIHPHIASRRKHVGRRHALLILAASVSLCGLVVMALFLLADPVMIIMFGEDFAATVPIVRILLIGSFLFCMRRLLQDILKGLGYPLPGSLSELVSWIVLLLLALELPGRYGPEGVAMATTMSYLAGLIVLLMLARRTRLTHREEEG